MNATITQFAVMEISLLGTLSGQFGNTSHRLTLALTIFDLILKHLCYILMDMQIVINLLLDKIAHIFINADTIGRHGSRAKLNLSLALENRLLYINRNCRYDTSTDITILVFAKKLFDGTGDMLFESTLMGTTLSGMLTIDE